MTLTQHFNISRGTVDKIMAFSTPPGYRREKPIPRPKLDGFTEIIDAWLDGDRDVPRKQRHTAKRIFDRLCAEHDFTGGYTIIKDYVRERACGRLRCGQAPAVVPDRETAAEARPCHLSLPAARQRGGAA